MKSLILKPIKNLTDEELSFLCLELDKAYRTAEPLVTDEAYDNVYMRALMMRIPQHPLITEVKPEPLTSKGRIKHPTPMLSTNKAYELDGITAYVDRCEIAAKNIGMSVPLYFRLTAKLDGLAARYHADKHQLVTRGDGTFGHDISHLLDQGLVLIDAKGQSGVGEVVVDLEYFYEYLAEEFSDPRTFVSGVANSDSLSIHAKKALQDGAIRLVFFEYMPKLVVSGDELVTELEFLVTKIKSSSSYLLDGVVIQIHGEGTDDLKSFMGSTSHHHNWQIAKKELGETAEADVLPTLWQVGRSGVISPVIIIEPTFVCNATIRKVTGHHAQYMINHGIGDGARIRITRSGQVIPRHLSTISSADAAIPEICPCCLEPTIRESVFLYCRNIGCSAQSVTKIIHHFKIIQTDLFGIKSVEKLVDAGFDTIEKIYPLTLQDYIDAGFGVGQATNFVKEIQRSLSEPLRDNLLLASMGISSLGRGASKKLLSQFKIDELDTVTKPHLLAIDGFGDVMSDKISKALVARKPTLDFLLSLRFLLDHTLDDVPVSSSGRLMGVSIVFTGTLSSGSRDDVSANAALLGATVQKTVNGKTKILVCGEKTSQSKMDKARDKGVEVISEAEYLSRFVD